MSGLLSERETFLNVALGAAALAEFTAAFGRIARPEAGVTMWHIVTVLPLVLHETSRRAIEKRLPKSGLRSILTYSAVDPVWVCRSTCGECSTFGF